MTFFSSPAKLTETTTPESITIWCLDALEPNDYIIQEFGRVVSTGTGDTGSGATGPSNYGAGPIGLDLEKVDVSADSGLPLGSFIGNNPSHHGHKLVMPDSIIDNYMLLERVGVFYCDTNTDDGRNDYTRIQQIVLAKNAVIKPFKRTVTINSRETVELKMQATNGATDLRWLLNGTPLPVCDDRSSCNASLAGIYECYYKGQRHLNIHGIMRVIARDCPADMWGPLSGCDKVCLDCINGGVCDDKIGDCICPPGFFGAHCEQTCGFNAVGPTCGVGCTSHGGCKNRYFCLPDPYGCCCATGHHGLSCEYDCDSNHFGADCALECHCASGGCNNYTGVCEQGGCATGWSGYNCQYITSSIVYFSNEKVNDNETTTFTCIIEAYPRPPESQIALLSSSLVDVNFEYGFDPDNHRATIVSKNMTVSRGEEFTCTVVSSCAVANCIFATIPVELFVPPALLNGPEIDIGNLQMTVKWNHWSPNIDLGDGPVSNYRVHFKLTNESSFTLLSETTETNVTVTYLKESTTYQFAITAYREKTGWGDYSPLTQASSHPGCEILSCSDSLSGTIGIEIIGGFSALAVAIITQSVIIFTLCFRQRYTQKRKKKKCEILTKKSPTLGKAVAYNKEHSAETNPYENIGNPNAKENSEYMNLEQINEESKYTSLQKKENPLK